MEGKSFRLVQYRLPLHKKKFGIKEPKNSYKFRTKNIDLAIVPIVGTDITLRRVGFGKGMYDRFFEKQKKHINYTLFITRKLFISEHNITDSHDISADMIII
ncbi:5-formyltetrahydrofolate cyclo-ligase (fragment 2) [Sulfurovum sp. enrichment culture clone C5]|uniref:5-formyltetrahydrofolate cyclo-ligase (Fragment 2) n=1 Tax=Sulfurovum sp. enrichment culture clone C5 TaxID=497650 RepID=A0A0S4XML1_9BACT|nr:5-formyltetrahydrofolate cyclo-ligase (fragment 2) [Sulfurovum sp. enrichment culture clone C5]